MALDTEFFLTIQLELVGKICALGIVAADAGHHLAVTRVKHLRSDRMTEGALAFVTATADCVAIAFEHGRGVAAMGTVAGEALVALLVAGSLASVAIRSILMTAQTDPGRGAGQ